MRLELENKRLNDSVDERKEFEPQRDDLRLPRRIARALFNEDGSLKDPDDRRQEVANVLASEELDALGITEDHPNHQTVLELFIKIATESHQAAEIRSASEPGIKHAPEVVAAVLGRTIDKVDIASVIDSVNYDALLAMVAESVDLNGYNFDATAVKQEILELMNQNTDMDEIEKKIIREIMQNNNDFDYNNLMPLLLAVTGVHISWAAIQDLRSTGFIESNDTATQVISWNAFKDDLVKLGKDPTDSDLNLLILDNDTVRIFRDSYRVLPAMVRAHFESEKKTDHNNALAKAMFEILKDIVKIGAKNAAIQVE